MSERHITIAMVRRIAEACKPENSMMIGEPNLRRFLDGNGKLLSGRLTNWLD